MFRKLGFASFSVGVLAFLFTVNSASAQVESGLHARALITQNIDEGKRVTLKGNTRHEAKAENDLGAVADDLPMEHMQLQLRRSSEQERALQQFIEELHTPGSPNFHRWITAQEFGERFGLAQQDLYTITGWLETHGFQVNVVYPSGMVIDFSGTAGQVRKAFQTEIHHLEVKGEKHIANMSDPGIPAALAPAVLGLVSLHDFRPHAMHKMRMAQPEYTFAGPTYALVPADLATIYNLNPLFSAGYSGQGQTIVVIEDTDVFNTSDWSTFRSTFGLSGYTSGSFTTVHPAPPSGTNNCRTPSVIAPNDAEAILDAEWASAAAPSAAIEMASCADTSTTFGGLIAIQNLINASSQPPAIMSISYGQCETVNGASANAAYSSAYQQAVSEGVSIFVASGDSGAAACDNSVAEATHGIGANAFASTPYNVAVGGTDFSDSYAATNSIYWNSTNSSTYGSAMSYIPEIPWNDSCAGVLLSNHLGYSTTHGPGSLCNDPFFGSLFLTTVSGGGGPSGCATGTPSTSGVVSGTCQGWPKPSWQSVVGNPSDGVRDTPDVSLFAADGLWGHYYVFCWSDTAHGGKACTGTPSGWSGAGGTSFSSPIMAGIQALVNQKTGARQGNPNPVYYWLAAAEYGPAGSSSCNSSLGNGVASSCTFYDVTLGDMDVDCKGSFNCFLDSSPEGVLSTSNNSYNPAYGTTTGWDFATGIGSVNAANLVNNWPTPSNSAVLSITKVHTGNFTQGQQNATYTVTVSNRANAAPTSGTVTVTETAPSGLTLVSMAGTGWTCAASSCTRSDALNGGASYPAITVTVNVAANASSPQVNQVSVSGGGSGNANASDSTVVIPNPAVLSITKTHTGNFTQGQRNATYTATVSNRANAAPTSGTVTVTETAPSGLTLVSMAGTGWTCAASSCTRSDALNGGGSYPAITVTVNVAANASSPQVNQVNVSGGGSGSAAATDSTTIIALPAAANLIGSDTSTRGNWHGVYGADGYSVANDTHSIPSYASFAVQNQGNWTWAASTTDVRALQNGANTGRIASTWYTFNPSAFNFDVNFTDGNSHQFALYAVDWDNAGRNETIQILDAITNAVLDTRNISGFANGVYLVWNISGHVKINVTWISGTNAVVSGVFFGGSSETVSISPQSVSLSAGQQQQFTATVTATSNQTVTWSISSVTPANAASGSISTTGLYTAPATITPAQVTVKATSADGTASGIATVNLIIASVANFVGSDTSTEGSWHGVYGADGYSVANDTQSIPSYASFAVQNQQTYTWTASTTDVRALQNGAGTGRIASAWYGSAFALDVNFADVNLHRFALYALDWDSTTRAETIQILDANTSGVLDTRTISNFTNGMYLVWNISGHVKINITQTGGANAVVSGVFFGGSSETVSISPQSVSLSAGQQQQFTATVTATSNQTVTWSISSVTPANAASGSISTTGLYTAPATITPAQVTVKATSADGTASGTATINLVIASVANFVGSDTSTEGSWHGVYGADGYSVANDSQSIPSYASFAVQNQLNWIWTSSTTDPRALQTGSGSGRIAATWYNNSTFDFDVNFTNVNSHQFELYVLDWDSQGRAETVQVLDANTNGVLDTRTISNFTNGIYLMWNISGHVKINITRTSGPNAVISGVFFR